MKVPSVCGTAVIPYSRAEKKGIMSASFANEPKGRKGKEKKGKTVFEGNDISGPTPSVGYHYSRGRVTCRQTMRETVVEVYSGDTHLYPLSSAWYRLALKDGGPSEKLEGWFPWRTIVESKEGPVTK